MGAVRLGAVAFPFGAGVPGQTDRAIDWMKEVEPTIFYGTPSYSLYIAERARAKGVDPAKDFNFRPLFFLRRIGSGHSRNERGLKMIKNLPENLRDCRHFFR